MSREVEEEEGGGMSGKGRRETRGWWRSGM